MVLIEDLRDIWKALWINLNKKQIFIKFYYMRFKSNKTPKTTRWNVVVNYNNFANNIWPSMLTSWQENRIDHQCVSGLIKLVETGSLRGLTGSYVSFSLGATSFSFSSFISACNRAALSVFTRQLSRFNCNFERSATKESAGEHGRKVLQQNLAPSNSLGEPWLLTRAVGQ